MKRALLLTSLVVLCSLAAPHAHGDQDPTVKASWLLPGCGDLVMWELFGYPACELKGCGVKSPDADPLQCVVGDTYDARMCYLLHSVCPCCPQHPVITYHTITTPTGPPGSGDYLGVDATFYSDARPRPHRGYRFVCESDAEYVVWYIEGMPPHVPVETDPTQELPSPYGYFVHKQKDPHFAGVHYPDESAPDMMNGGPTRETPGMPHIKRHEIEFVPVRPGTFNIWCIGITGPHQWRDFRKVEVVDARWNVSEGRVKTRLPDLCQDPARPKLYDFKLPGEKFNAAVLNTQHKFVGERASAPAELIIRYKNTLFASPGFSIDCFIYSVGDGQAAFESTEHGALKNFDSVSLGAPNAYRMTYGYDKAKETMLHIDRTFTNLFSVFGLKATSRPGGVMVGVQINREKSFGTEDGGWQSMYAETSLGMWSNDGTLDTEDKEALTVGVGENGRLDTLDLNLDGVVSDSEKVPGITLDEDKPAKGLLTFLDREDIDDSGGDHEDGGDIEAVQSGILGITVFRADLRTTDLKGIVVPDWLREEREHACFVPINDDNDDAALGDKRKDYAQAPSPREDDLKNFTLRMHPTREAILAAGVEDTFLDGGGVELSVDKLAPPPVFVCWRDSKKTKALTQNSGFDGDDQLYFEAKEPKGDDKLYSVINVHIGFGEGELSNQRHKRSWGNFVWLEKNGERVRFRTMLLDIAMDGNRDSTIEDSLDDRKYLFWVNDDMDRGSHLDQEYDVASGTLDCNDTKILCVRDIEDFTRLHIWIDENQFEDLLEYRLELSGGGAVNIFNAVDETLEYQRSTLVAEKQMLERRLVPVSTQVRLPLDWDVDKTLYPFVLEGSRKGKGALTLSAWEGNVKVASKSMELELRPASEFVEKYVVSLTTGDFVSSGSTKTGKYTYVPESPDYLLFVHGWGLEQFEKDRWAETVFKRLWWLGYKGSVGCFQWPTLDGLGRGELCAWRCGAALSALLRTLDGRNRGQVRVLAHSLANAAMGEALRLPATPRIHTYIASQAAISAHFYSNAIPASDFPIGFGPSTPDVIGHYPTGADSDPPYLAGSLAKVGVAANYFNPDDGLLSKWWFYNYFKPDMWYEYEEADGDLVYDFLEGDKFVYDSLALLDERILNIPADRFEIFARCAESRSKALGTAPAPGFGISNDLRSYGGFDNTAYSHSRQFQSNMIEMRLYWKKVVNDAQLTRH